jgi:hypothetical protein
MLASDWTALLARELLAELRRQAERQHLARLAGATSCWQEAVGSVEAMAWLGGPGPGGARLAQRLPWRGAKPLRQGGEQA